MCSQTSIEELAYPCVWSMTVLLTLSAVDDLPPNTITAPTPRLTRRLFNSQSNSVVNMLRCVQSLAYARHEGLARYRLRYWGCHTICLRNPCLLRCDALRLFSRSETDGRCVREIQRRRLWLGSRARTVKCFNWEVGEEVLEHRL